MNDLKKYSVHISGIVQGVGMRPYIYKIARQFHLGGWVSNQGTSVVVEIAGRKECIHGFLTVLLKNQPQGAKISSIKIEAGDYTRYKDFSIITSTAKGSLQGFIPPDTAVCDACIKEVYDKGNRRYLYPFTNCTCCGPRYSILKALPYDRSNTSMAAFEMCPSCRNEYEDPGNRRFHAQTNCCPNCGPKLILLDNAGKTIDSTNPVSMVRQLISEGRLIAIKGIGGYHLACNALDEMSVDLLRLRKRRPDRPLAVMAADLEAVKSICKTTPKEEEILAGRQRPIVLLEKKSNGALPYRIAPGINRLGVMLPYTPLHHLLFDDGLQYLVMTSGNVSGMPICYKDADSWEKLKYIADFFLLHDREILTPIDDSVVRVIDDMEMVSRSARGYAPAVIPMKAACGIMAMGAEQKSSICFVHRGYAHISQYLGSLDDLNAYEEYHQVIKRTKAFLGTEPEIIAHDLHPGYLSTQLAAKVAIVGLPIQHHHAHMAACMAEHGLKKDVIGIIYDGTGMGTDGAIWGGEFLVGSISGYIRAGHWKNITLQGGDNAVKEPWKCAAGYLYAMGFDIREFLRDIDAQSISILKNAMKHHVNCFTSSSIGRLFDCVAALVINRTRITYDAQAAIELESVIDTGVDEDYPYSIIRNEEKLEINYEGILNGILEDLKDGKPASYISARFHNAVSKGSIECALRIRSKYRINDIVLAGGVFENAYLLAIMRKELKDQGFSVYRGTKVPANDGGIALGQAAIAAGMVKEGDYVPGGSGKDNIHL